MAGNVREADNARLNLSAFQYRVQQREGGIKVNPRIMKGTIPARTRSMRDYSSSPKPVTHPSLLARVCKHVGLITAHGSKPDRSLEEKRQKCQPEALRTGDGIRTAIPLAGQHPSCLYCNARTSAMTVSKASEHARVKVCYRTNESNACVFPGMMNECRRNCRNSFFD